MKPRPTPRPACRGVLAVVLAAALSGAVDARAQCALCGQAARYAGPSPQRATAALLAGTIVLLVPPVAVAACVGRFVWRARRT